MCENFVHCLNRDNPLNPPYQGDRILELSGVFVVMYVLSESRIFADYTDFGFREFSENNNGLTSLVKCSILFHTQHKKEIHHD